MLLDFRPTAIIALNDHFAQLAFFWCQIMGIRVPQDVSIVSFDNMTRSILFPLSTIDFGFLNLGYIAAHLFSGDIPPPRATSQGVIAGPCTLIDRGSITPRETPAEFKKYWKGSYGVWRNYFKYGAILHKGIFWFVSNIIQFKKRLCAIVGATLCSKPFVKLFSLN